MANQQLGNAQEAKQLLHRVLQRIALDLSPATDQQPVRDSSLEDWLICQTLRREAVGLIGNDETAATAGPRR